MGSKSQTQHEKAWGTHGIFNGSFVVPCIPPADTSEGCLLGGAELGYPSHRDTAHMALELLMSNTPKIPPEILEILQPL